jgi:hypothetical protein
MGGGRPGRLSLAAATGTKAAAARISFLGYRPAVHVAASPLSWWRFARRGLADRALYMQLYREEEAGVRTLAPLSASDSSGDEDEPARKAERKARRKAEKAARKAARKAAKEQRKLEKQHSREHNSEEEEDAAPEAPRIQILGSAVAAEFGMLELRLTTAQVMLFRDIVDAELAATAQQGGRRGRRDGVELFTAGSGALELSAEERAELYQAVHRHHRSDIFTPHNADTVTRPSL